MTLKLGVRAPREEAGTGSTCAWCVEGQGGVEAGVEALFGSGGKERGSGRGRVGRGSGGDGVREKYVVVKDRLRQGLDFISR